MRKPELKWTFEEAPAPGEARPPWTRPPGRDAPRFSASPRAVRRFCLSVAGLLAVGAVAALLLVQGGWRRLSTQLAAEIAYEDEHARAGDAALVLALQSTNAALASEWLDRRAEEVALGLAAPLPAAHLTPDDAAPVVAEVEALGGNEFLATVVRTYHDSAGRPAAFALPQRYRNLGPGLWERLPPDVSELQSVTVFAGERLSATLPVVDLPWLSESLLAADQLLVQACADWGGLCAPDWKLLVRFSGALGAHPPRRAFNAAGVGPYPAAFDLADLAPRYRQALVLLSPHLSGLPYDAGARQALTHALTVHGLGYLAGVLAGTPSGHIAGALFRDALAARAELRLGLSPAPTYTLCAEHYAPLSTLWNTAHNPGDAGWPHGAATLADELPLRLLALDLLNAALAGQPPSADAALLAGLCGTRHNGDLLLWLDQVLGPGGAERAAGDWQAAALASFHGGCLLDWARLQGLAYKCGGETHLIRDGETLDLRALGSGFGLGQAPQAVSPDGCYLAYLGYDSEGERLLALDLRRSLPLSLYLAATPEAYVVGWSAAGALVTVERVPETTASLNTGLSLFRAWRSDPAAGERAQLTEAAVLPNLFAGGFTWTPDRASVLLNGYFGPAGEQDLAALAPVLLRVDPPGAGTIQRLPRSGYAALLSPDGRQAAYTVPISDTHGFVHFGPVEVYDLASGRYRELLSAQDLPGSEPAAADDFWILPLAWSPDGQWLLIMALGDDYGARLLAQPVAGGPPSVLHSMEDRDFLLGLLRFSADGRYLAYVEYGFDTAAQPLRLLEPAEFSSSGYALPEPLALDVTSVAWSPTGRLLALAGPSGMRIFDPASGQMRWVTLEACDSVAWYDLGQ